MRQMTRILIVGSIAIVLLTACGTTISSIDDITARLNKNRCRINREELIFQIGEQEYLQDTTFYEIPQLLFDDSLLVCPSNEQFYFMVVDGNDRSIECPSIHGDSSF